MSAVLIGFALLFSLCDRNGCEWEAATEDVYPTEQDCLRVAQELEKHHPHEDFVCGEVHRAETEEG